MVLVGLGLALRDMNSVGWAVAFSASGLLLQALGHWYEGRRRHLGVMGWLVAPLFVGLQGLHQLGWAQGVWDSVERAAGPRRMRDLASGRL
jgi:uncharacterized membrane protein YGL010W